MSLHLNGSLVPLSIGTPAPAFALSQAPRSLLGLHSLGGQAVVLVFYPMDWEPVSRGQLTIYQAFSGAFDRFGA
jgi:peroxiredoxin